jgi:hypothetical protein
VVAVGGGERAEELDELRDCDAGPRRGLEFGPRLIDAGHQGDNFMALAFMIAAGRG